MVMSNLFENLLSKMSPSKLTWKKLAPDTVNYGNYYEFYINKEHKGDIFQGKKCWHLIVFGKSNIRGSNLDELLLHLKAILVDKDN